MIDRYGGWPVVKGDDWDEEHWDWIDTIGKMTEDGFEPKHILSIFVTETGENSTEPILAVKFQRKFIENFR